MALSRLTTWSAGQVLAATALNAEFDNVLTNPLSLISTASVASKGLLLIGDGSALAGLAVGSDAWVLTADSTQATGVKWAAAAGGGAPGFNAITSGTNSAASMVVGTGASVVPTGTGIIRATDMLFGSDARGDLPLRGASGYGRLAGVATGNALISGGVGADFSWGKVGLTTHVSGTLPVANGGTGVTNLANLYVGAPNQLIIGSNSNQGRIEFHDGHSSNTLQLSCPDLTSSGGYYFTLPQLTGSAGYQLANSDGVGTTAWTAASSLRDSKHLLDTAQPIEALAQIRTTPVYHFRYKDGQGTGDTETMYVGPVAEEAPWAMHHKGGIVNPVNTLGYMILAVQALDARITRIEDAV